MKKENQSAFKYDYKYMCYRLVSWILYTVLISFIPLGVQAYVSSTVPRFSPDKTTDLLEILIIAIIISANTLKDLFEGELHTQKKLFSFIMLFICLFTIATPSLMYGVVIATKALYTNFNYSSAYTSAYAKATLSAQLSFFVGLLVRIMSSLKKVPKESSNIPMPSHNVDDTE